MFVSAPGPSSYQPIAGKDGNQRVPFHGMEVHAQNPHNASEQPI